MLAKSNRLTLTRGMRFWENRGTGSRGEKENKEMDRKKQDKGKKQGEMENK